MKQSSILKYGVLTLLVGVVVVGHAVIFHRLTSHLTRDIVLALISIAILKHVGILGSIHAVIKRRSRGST